MTPVYRDAEIEAPSGKGAGDENFPVGSFLIAAPLRPHVKAYYDFARAADDIGDCPELSSEDKVHRLTAYCEVLHGEAEGLTRPDALRRSLLACDIPLERGSDLLRAFSQDAVQNRTRSLLELLDYCSRSANPVGQFLLDLHGEDRALFTASDALCTSLQILNHVQDCADDLRDLDRSYLPLDWLEEEGAEAGHVLGREASPGLRRVFDRLLAVCADLNDRAEPLVSELRSRRLAAESAVILRLARRLTRKLLAHDPVAGRVSLSKADFLEAGARGVVAAALQPRRAA